MVLLNDMPIDELGLNWWRYFLFINWLPSSSSLWHNLNGYWCMPLFIYFYIIAPILKKKVKTIFSFISVIFTLYVSLSLLTHFCDLYKIMNVAESDSCYYSSFRVLSRLPVFFLGSLVWYIGINDIYIKYFIAVVLIVCAFMFSIAWNDFFAWGIMSAALIALFKEYNWEMPIAPFVKWLSNISFTIFLVHLSIISYLNRINLNRLEYIVLFLVITIITAVTLNYFIEKPFEVIKGSILRKLKQN